MAVTLKMIAERAGVSIMAVSTVLNQKGNSGVSVATRRRIEDIARELNYHPNHLARATRTGIVQTIGVITNWCDYSSMRNVSEVMYGIQQVAAAADYGVRLYGAENLKWTFSEIASQRVTHVILISVNESIREQVAAYCRKMSLALVFANGPGGFGFPGVIMDNFTAMYEIVSHLALQGHRRIGLVCSPHFLHINRERHRGYEQAILDAGLELRPEWQTCGEYPNREGLLSLLEFKGARRLSAIAAVASNWLFDIIRYSVAKGTRIPHDLSLACLCTDPGEAGHSLVSLSHSEYKPVDIGTNAAQLLFSGGCPLAADGEGTYLVKPVFIPMESTTPFRGYKSTKRDNQEV